jgi:SWI/SNF-related matrix-associated actin-dependent regulator 1 of chromatin subfamily A
VTPDQRLKASFATSTAFRACTPAGCDPYPFQHAGVEYVRDLPAAIIADEPGLGKTIQGIGWLNQIAARRPLIVCPASLRINWRRELEKWAVWDPETTVVSYNEVQRGKVKGRFDAALIDEAQYLKNPDSQRSEVLLKRLKCPRMFLTGTPIVSRPIELWPLLNSIDPATWGNMSDYGMTYCGGRWNGREWDYRGASNLVELQRRLRSSFMVRRRKADVLTDLPPKVRQLITLPAESAGPKTAELLAAVRQLWKAKQQALTPEAVAALAPHREVVQAQLSKVRHEEALAKVPAIVAHCRDLLEGGVQKLVVFAHHRDVMQAIDYQLSAYKPVRVIGGMTDERKQQSVDTFQNVEDCRVFMGQLQAAGVGLTLTAAHTVVFAELDWVPGVMTQCEDRCHRIGQRDSVLVHHLVVDGSLDARIARSLIRKQSVLDQALDGTSLSAEYDWVTALATGETEAA